MSRGSLGARRTLTDCMACGHTGFHRITSRYDRPAGVLVYVRVCERCSTSLGEILRIPYRPHFEPVGERRPTAS